MVKPFPASKKAIATKTTKVVDENLSVQELAKSYDEVVLVLQGGGALGSYQAGVFEGLLESGIEPDWISGISIGALNTAIIAGNKPENRLAAMKGFWETICRTNLSLFSVAFLNPLINGLNISHRRLVSSFEASRALVEGQNGFFTPRSPLPIPFLSQCTPDQISYYKTENLKLTLEKYVDFNLLNKGHIRVSVGAVNVKTGNFVYFDNTKQKLKAEHFMASGALPPGFPAVEIDGEFYWDGGLVSNTPLYEVLNNEQDKDRLVFQVDLWSAKGALPENFMDVSERTKDIQYSSRTRMVTDMMAERQKTKKVLQELIKQVPVNMQNEWYEKAKEMAQDARTNVIQMIYRDKSYEGHCKDFEFSSATMHEHWSSGLTDIRETLRHKQWLEKPSVEKSFVTHDIHKVR